MIDNDDVVMAVNVWVFMECIHWMCALLLCLFFRTTMKDPRSVASLSEFVEVFPLAWFGGHFWVIDRLRVLPYLGMLRLAWRQITGTHFAWKTFLCCHHEA